ncbi:bifunctional phosphopantothenoylcysteine decarboxylase/phosphopantothenate--cysteine ligase CoaBC [uncultured Gilvimarinus sp.]|jgi:phosphopantothenoylcysteine decarboxylase/phosphopantothenate--cysteine ligase|uniref:bifunctional phosphopantothenoylcysteine decarboxylase/phosphopantothenate--cysteine ligase CoaBC n=1 Tax=uncultured Gilvimarinus sp. TaxID=1689143 RepID=UPI0030D6D2D4
MSTLQNKRILLGVTGGIAAYKTAELVRELRRRGASVRVVMTMAACEFITPLTLQALSGNPVHTSLLDPEAEAAMGHIELARWADLTLIAPASADFLARLSGGMGDDLLSTVCLATRSPIAIAPAMNQAMWDAPSTQANITRLRQRDFIVLGPGSGEQACGEFGPGRMLEPVELAAQLEQMFNVDTLTGKTVVITAGPTREAIDPVRYLSNHSSGKMGYALAEAAAEAGARTILISGPCQLAPPERVEHIKVISADDMLAACLDYAAGSDLFIGAAAVADFRPANIAEQKLKKSDADTMTLTLVKNPDIIASVAALDAAPFTVAFAAESERVLEYARDKLVRKKVDCVIANDISAAGIGFNSDDNAVTLIDRRGETRFDQRSKPQLARELIALLAERL